MIPSNLTQLPKETNFTYRDYKNIAPEDLVAQLGCCDWTCFDAEVVDNEQALDCLCTNLTAAMDTLAPEKTVAPKKGRLPWINVELVQLLRRRDTLYRRYKRTGQLALYEEFITLRKQIDEQTDIAKTTKPDFQMPYQMVMFGKSCVTWGSYPSIPRI